MAALVLYASQRGRSEEVAKELFAQAQTKGLGLSLKCMDEIGSGFFITVPGVCVLILSSTGDGEVPDNGQTFYNWLSEQDEGELSGLKYALLGLGDSNYFKYQCAPKKFDRLLDSLGATALVPRGAADEQEALEKVIIPWIQNLWSPLTSAMELMQEYSNPMRTLPARVRLGEKPIILESRVLERRILSERRAKKKLIELTLSACGQTYSPGGTLSIYPENDSADVTEVLARLNFNPNHVITSESFLPQAVRWRTQMPVTLFEFFMKYVEVSGPVSKSFVDYFCRNLKDLGEVMAIRKIAAESRKATLLPPYSLLHLVRTYPRFRSLYLEETLPLLPPLRPRCYSISSTPLTQPTTLTITFCVEGVCTRYMDKVSRELDQSVPTSLHVSFNSGTSAFWQPIIDNERSIVVTTGVGLSPFRAILEHLSLTSPRQLWIIHGCRQTSRNTSAQNFDFVYEEEVKNYLERMGGKLSLAESNGNQEKGRHVQDIIREETETLRTWSSVAVICGSLKIGEMKETLRKVNSTMTVVSEDWV